MTCREAAEFIMDYLAGELDAEIVARFEQHLSRCEPCRRYLAGYQATLALERGAVRDDPCELPEELTQAILEALRR